jgi:hypothetical protein
VQAEMLSPLSVPTSASKFMTQVGVMWLARQPAPCLICALVFAVAAHHSTHYAACVLSRGKLQPHVHKS